MTARVVWCNVPDEARSAIEPLLMANLYRIPGWCVELRVTWNDESDFVLNSRVQAEYRTGAIEICPAFLRRDPKSRADDVLHELVHFAVDPLHSLVHRLIVDAQRAGASDAMIAWFKEEARRCVELATCDVTEMLRQTEGEERFGQVFGTRERQAS